VAALGWRHEAQQFERDLPERLKGFGLELAWDKTQTIRFGRRGGEHNGRFDLLGLNSGGRTAGRAAPSSSAGPRPRSGERRWADSPNGCGAIVTSVSAN